MIEGWGISCSEIALIWMSLDFTDDQLTLVQVMAWCRQATSHYLNQCWPRSLSPYGVTRPQWVNSLTPGKCCSNVKSIFFKLIIQNSSLGASLGWRALKTPTSETPDLEVRWPWSCFNTSGPDPLGFDWEDLAASRGTVGGHMGSVSLLSPPPCQATSHNLSQYWPKFTSP